MNKTEKGYVYFWDSNYNQDDGVIKLGISSSLADRKGSYKTSNYKPGKYIFAFEIPYKMLKIIDRHLKNHFHPYHRYLEDGGTEFYDRKIIPLLEPHLQTLNLFYRELSQEEIQMTKRKERERKDVLYSLPPKILETTRQFLEKIDAKRIIRRLQKNRKNRQIVLAIEPSRFAPICPLPHQQEVLDRTPKFYEENDIGRLIWACGLGKTLESVFIAQKMNFKKVLFGVPSIELQGQVQDEILKIYPDPSRILLIGGGSKKQQVSLWLQNDDKPCFVITTYHSCSLILNEPTISFDFKVGDEAHHLVGVMKTEEERGFRLFHKIPARKTLFMTATEKIMEVSQNDEKQQVFSMDDPDVFGYLLDEKTVRWAIENGKITDYSALVLKMKEDEIERIMSQIKMEVIVPLLLVSCFMVLKAMDCGLEGVSHLFLYTNTTAEAELAKQYIEKLLEYNEQQKRTNKPLLFSRLTGDQLYNRALHSRIYGLKLKTEVEKFKRAKYGIIPCVYIFSEGFNCPKLNGVCISGNMGSVTRIIQSLLRPNRLDCENPNKKAIIILPYIETEEWLPNGQKDKPFENIMNISFQMRNVDANIENKIRLLSLCEYDCEKDDPQKQEYVEKETGGYEWREDVMELNRLKMRLKKSKVLPFDFTEEQDEYNFMRERNRGFNVQSKKEYHLSQKYADYIPNPEEYFMKKGVWTNWYDFLGTETGGFLRTREEWKCFCRENGIGSARDYEKACSVYENVLPKDPEEFYPEFTNLMAELGYVKKRRYGEQQGC